VIGWEDLLLLSATDFSKAHYSLFVLKVPLNPSQSNYLLSANNRLLVCTGEV